MSAIFPPRRVLVAIDFSELGDRALAYAVGVADNAGAHLIALHVVEPAPMLSTLMPQVAGEPGADWGDVTRERVQAARELLELRLANLSLGSWEAVVVVAQPADGIVDTAEQLDADIVVLASHGRTGVKRALLGSVAELTVRHATRPILVVR